MRFFDKNDEPFKIIVEFRKLKVEQQPTWFLRPKGQ
jgi:hypothetical protein